MTKENAPVVTGNEAVDQIIDCLQHAKMLIDFMAAGVDEPVDHTAIDLAIHLVISRYEHRWHDLNKEPDDLPEEDGNYWVHGHWASGKEAEGEAEYKTADKRFRASWNFTVDAWKKVEPFKEASE